MLCEQRSVTAFFHSLHTRRVSCLTSVHEHGKLSPPFLPSRCRGFRSFNEHSQESGRQETHGILNHRYRHHRVLQQYDLRRYFNQQLTPQKGRIKRPYSAPASRTRSIPDVQLRKLKAKQPESQGALFQLRLQGSSGQLCSG